MSWIDENTIISYQCRCGLMIYPPNTHTCTYQNYIPSNNPVGINLNTQAIENKLDMQSSYLCTIEANIKDLVNILKGD